MGDEYDSQTEKNTDIERVWKWTKIYFSFLLIFFI
jgi:hypothetical protein